MIQEILALIIVGIAVIYTVFQTYRFFIPSKALKGCSSVCSGCEINQIKSKKIKIDTLTYCK